MQLCRIIYYSLVTWLLLHVSSESNIIDFNHSFNYNTKYSHLSYIFIKFVLSMAYLYIILKKITPYYSE